MSTPPIDQAASCEMKGLVLDKEVEDFESVNVFAICW